MTVKEAMVLEFQEIDKGLQEVLLVSGETSPLVTPERLAELHERGLLERPPSPGSPGRVIRVQVGSHHSSGARIKFDSASHSPARIFCLV